MVREQTEKRQDHSADKAVPHCVSKKVHLLLIAVVVLITTLFLYNISAGYLARRLAQKVERDEITGVEIGSETREFGSEKADQAVLLLHGAMGSVNDFGDLPGEMAKVGWFVRAVRLSGHRKMPKDLEEISSAELVDGVVTELVRLKQRYPTVVVIGHSFGGTLATIAMNEEPADGLIVVAPYLGLGGGQSLDMLSQYVVGAFSRCVCWLPGPGKYVPSRFYVRCIEVARRATAPGIFESIDAPILAIESALEMIDNEPIYGRLQTDNAIFVDLEETTHGKYFSGSEKEVVYDAIFQFLSEIGTQQFSPQSRQPVVP